MNLSEFELPMILMMIMKKLVIIMKIIMTMTKEERNKRKEVSYFESLYYVALFVHFLFTRNLFFSISQFVGEKYLS